MCGISGIISRRPTVDLISDVSTMLAEIAHRGPDGDGLWSDAANGCVLGHKRLSIIDPGGGMQPLCNEDGTIWVTFNGCIFNYPELANELKKLGHVFTTRSDTEIIVHAYEEWGDGCVDRFNGMWAFALWDMRRRRLLCVRDRFGVKPFYWRFDARGFAFASEIKALLATQEDAPQADPDGLRQYLSFQFCIGDRTMFSGIRRLPPGCLLIIEPDSEPVERQWWDLHFDHADLDETESDRVARLSWLLEDSIRIQLRSDVPLGAHLSGGLDSSAVVCMARRLLGDASLSTFTGAFSNGPLYDETGFAKMVSAHARTRYFESYLDAGHFSDSIAKIIWHLDEPAAGPGVFPQYWVSRLAGQHVKVVLGGQGGDEVFIGYARYLVSYLEECLKGAIHNTAHTGRYVATLATIVPNLPTLESYLPMLKNLWRDGLFEDGAKRYFAMMDRFSDAKSLVHPDLACDQSKTWHEFEQVFNVHGATSLVNRMLYFDTKTQLQSLLQVEDRTSMAWGLESRVPLLDYRLAEAMARIPPVVKFRNGELKCMFRKMTSSLVPQEVLNRKDKMGFPVPLNEWARGPLRGMINDILRSQACRTRGIFDPRAIETLLDSNQVWSRSLWGALCLELWHSIFIDGHKRKAPPSKPIARVSR